MKTSFFVNLKDIGFCIKVNKQSEYSLYKIGIDIQILFFNVYIGLLKKKIYETEY